MKNERVKDRLKGLDVRPSKSRGQNFLIDPAVIDQIVEFGAPRQGELLVEIGPGLGALTAALNSFGLHSVIEIEERFCGELKKRYPGLRVINEDVRKVQFSQFGNDLVVFGNLPYSLSTDIVFHLLSQGQVIRRAVLLLQKEFSERMAAGPGGRDYGVLSVSCQMGADMQLGPVIKGNCFHPPAGVDSRLIELKLLKEPRFKVSDPEWFKKVVKGCFSRRRKKIHNSFMSSGISTRESMEAALKIAGIDPGCRAETLSVESFVLFSEALKRTGGSQG